MTTRRQILAAAALLAAASTTAIAAGTGAAALTPASVCPPVGAWKDLATGEVLAGAAALDRLAAADAVLLGESHGFPDIHLWQAAVGAAVADRRGKAQYGYEMLPRGAQSALDAWAAGETNRATFLADAGWSGVWGFAADAYDPILRLPRLRGEAAIALNVDRSLVRRVGKEGWAAIPEDERLGIGQPAEALPAYRSKLAAILSQKSAAGTPGFSDPKHGKAPEKSSASHGDASKAGERFLQAQLVWDRAFAEAIADGLKTTPEAPVVAFLGRGHVEHGHGVAHQLADLGVDNVATAIAVFSGPDCKVEPDAAGRPMADLVYGLPQPLPEPGPPPRPRIGVYIQNADGGGAEITRVSDDSPAEAAGFTAGDVVTEAAGQAVATAADLGHTIRSHMWGAWLPFAVTRDGEDLEIIVKLPKAPPA